MTRCTQCGEMKPPEAFSRDKRQRSGRRSACKSCAAAYRQQRMSDPAKREAKNERDRQRRAAFTPAQLDAKREAQRECVRRLVAEYSTRSDAECDAAFAAMRPDGLKTCRVCRRALPRDAFARQRARADGRCQQCRTCDAVDHCTPELLERWADLDDWRCYLCGCDFDDATPMHIEHVIPRARHSDPRWADADADDVHNLRPACASCNLSKGTRTAWEFWRAAEGDPTCR